ncbi:MAG: hypothetical protein QNJ58_15955, partial [Desulfobacterales bacterium]|nr:hypothetical protein [Desulfobacterales bacterium]
GRFFQASSAAHMRPRVSVVHTTIGTSKRDLYLFLFQKKELGDFDKTAEISVSSSCPDSSADP